MPKIKLSRSAASSSSPPQHPQNTASPPQQPQSTSSPTPPRSSFSFTAPLPVAGPTSIATAVVSAASTTESASPAFSPLTPKVTPVFPVPIVGIGATAGQQDGGVEIPQQQQEAQEQTEMRPPPPPPHQPSAQLSTSTTAIAPAEFIPLPPPQPFSSDDSVDALALKAAISALQFQKMKAQEDIKALEEARKKALKWPEQFKDALVQGKVREERRPFGGVQNILDAKSEDEEDEDEEEEGEELNATGGEIADSQPSANPEQVPPETDKPPDFGPLPGPQDIVRMPHINWEKYHIVGEALDRMHEQQRRWPGSSFAYGQDRGREFVVAAPYSPFQDVLVGDQQGLTGGDTGARQQSTAGSVTSAAALVTPTSAISEHPMATRRGSKPQAR